MNATAETRVNAAPCRTDGRVGQASSLSAPNRQDASPTPTHWVSWKAPFRFSASIGTMNQIGAPLPALSPQGGERVAEGRERGGSWVASTIPESQIETMNRRRTGARTALSASSLDLIRADMAVRAPIGGPGNGRTVLQKLTPTWKPANRAPAATSSLWLLARLAFTCVLPTLLQFFAQASEADLILRSGKVVTVDERFSIHEAIAVEGGRIVQVGGD